MPAKFPVAFFATLDNFFWEFAKRVTPQNWRGGDTTPRAWIKHRSGDKFRRFYTQ